LHSPIYEPLKLVLWGAIFLAAVRLFVTFFGPKIKGHLGERAVARALSDAGLEAMHDVILRDDRGGLTQIDHLVRLPVGIAALETKNYSGAIYGKANEARWTQVIGGRKHGFQNPLRQNYAHVEAVKMAIPRGVEVFTHVIFVGGAQFPKGMPDEVSTLDEFRRQMRGVKDIPISDEIGKAWDALCAAVIRDKTTRSEHLAAVKGKH
jgi:hypothetical protein